MYRKQNLLGIVAHAYNPNIWEAESEGVHEFEG